MDFPQLVGLKCSSCNKTISSVAEGTFCSACNNPVHLKCMPPPRTPIAQDRCEVCGSDPESPIAQEIKAEVEEHIASGYTNIVCPNCGSTHGFRSASLD